MDVKEGIRRGIRQKTDQALRRVGKDSEIQTPPAEAAADPTPNLPRPACGLRLQLPSNIHNHGARGPDSNCHRSL